MLSEYKEVYVKYIDLFQPVGRGQYMDKLTLVCDGNEIIMREHHNTTPDDYRDMENMITGTAYESLAFHHGLRF